MTAQRVRLKSLMLLHAAVQPVNECAHANHLHDANAHWQQTQVLLDLQCTCQLYFQKSSFLILQCAAARYG